MPLIWPGFWSAIKTFLKSCVEFSDAKVGSKWHHLVYRPTYSISDLRVEEPMQLVDPPRLRYSVIIEEGQHTTRGCSSRRIPSDAQSPARLMRVLNPKLGGGAPGRTLYTVVKYDHLVMIS